MPNLADTISYYVDLLLYQYRDRPKARQTIAIYVKQALGDLLIDQVANGFDVDTAVGAQLDVIGKYVGVSRLIGLPIERPYFGFTDSTNPVPPNPNGFRDSTNPAVNAQSIWYQSVWYGNQNTALTDAEYRLLIKLKILTNSNDGTLATIQQGLYDLLPGSLTLTDNADMTLTYTLSQETPVAPEILQDFLPKPMGVSVTFDYLTAVAMPGSATGTLVTAVPGLHTVNTLSGSNANPSGGTGPYHYNWERLSETNPYGAGITANSAGLALTTFGMTAPLPWASQAIFRCVVTDSLGLVAYTQDVTVDLDIHS